MAAEEFDSLFSRPSYRRNPVIEDSEAPLSLGGVFVKKEIKFTEILTFIRASCIFTPSLSLHQTTASMQLKPVASFDTIDPELFRKEFYEPGVPVVLRH